MSDATRYSALNQGRMSSREESAPHTRPLSPHRDTYPINSNNSPITEAEPRPLNNTHIMMDENALTPDVGTEADFEVKDNPFAFTPGQLSKMLNPRSLPAFFALGGLDGLERGLRTDRKAGLSVDETVLHHQVSFEEATANTNRPVATSKVGTSEGGAYQDRRRVFSDNRLPEKKPKSLLELMWLTYNDKVLILLSVAAVVSLAVGLHDSFSAENNQGGPEWVEGVAIIVAIAIVVIVGAANDYQKERQFARLNRKKQDRLIKVIRSGKTKELSVHDVLVGDLLHLESGDLVPVDGVLIQSYNVKCDESSATGESDTISKQPADDVYAAIKNHENLERMDPFIISGSRIVEGVGVVMTTATGVHSSFGRTMMSLREEPETATPLQAKLNALARFLATIGGLAGILLVILLAWSSLKLPPRDSKDAPSREGLPLVQISFVVFALVAAIAPERLVVAASLALDTTKRKLRADNPMLPRLEACEGIRNARSISSRMTDALTRSGMHVVSRAIGIPHSFSYQDFESWPPPDARQADKDLVFGDTLRRMTFVGGEGIRDSLRHHAAGAADACHRTSNSARIVTGDSRMTALSIAEECGLLQSGQLDGIVMEGPVFHRLSPTEIAAQRLIWERTIKLAEKRCLRFQLRASAPAALSALLVAVAGASQSAILTAVQLLWVNLIMDTFAALALATTPPDRELKPKDSIGLWNIISRQALHQLPMMFLLLYYSSFGGVLLLHGWNSGPPHDQSITSALDGSQALVMLLGGLAFLSLGDSQALDPHRMSSRDDGTRPSLRGCKAELPFCFPKPRLRLLQRKRVYCPGNLAYAMYRPQGMLWSHNA